MLLLLLSSHYKPSRSLSPVPPSVSILCTTPTLDSADFRGHRLTYLEKVYEKKNWTPDVYISKINLPKTNGPFVASLTMPKLVDRSCGFPCPRVACPEVVYFACASRPVSASIIMIIYYSEYTLLQLFFFCYFCVFAIFFCFCSLYFLGGWYYGGIVEHLSPVLTISLSSGNFVKEGSSRMYSWFPPPFDGSSSQ